MKFRPAHLLRVAVPAALIAGSLVVLTSSSGSAAEEPKAYEPPFKNRHLPVGKPAYEPNAVVVKFKKSATTSKRKAVLSKYRTTTEDSVSNSTVRITGDTAAPELLKKVKADPAVEVAQLNYVRTADAVPNDLYYPMYAPGWGQANAMNTIRMPQAWDLSKTNGSQIVAVLDTGVDLGHPDLAGHLVQGFNALSPARPNNPTDDEGHGTMTLGIIAAGANNQIGTAGIGWNAKAMPVKVLNSLGQGYDQDIIEGLDWAVAHGAKVVNMSFGSAVEDGTLLHEAIKRAYAKGVVIVASSGNNGGGELRYPASYPEVIAVGATEHGGALTSFSSYGDWVDIAAPGYRILTTGSRAFTDPGDDPVWSCTGTSCSAPIVAGVAAMVKNKWPTYTPAQVAARLKSTARDAGARGNDPYYGAGILDAYGALGGRFTTDFAAAGVDGNDQPARATAINTSGSGSAIVEGDVDWFKVSGAAATRNLRVSVTGPRFDESAQMLNFAPRVDVYNSLLQSIGSAENPFPQIDPDGNPLWGPLTATANVSAPAGDVYIAVRNSNGSRDGRTYSVSVTEAGTGGATPATDYTAFDAQPADRAAGVAVAVKPSITFARGAEAATVSATTVRLVNAKTGAAVAATVDYTDATKTAGLTPTAPLFDNVTYRIIVNGVHEMSAPIPMPEFSSVFTTVDLAPPALETFDASGSFQKANLGWKIPALADLDQIVVRRNTGGKYPTPTTGTVVYSGTASSFQNVGLPQGATYTYVAWVKDRSGKLSAGKGTQLVGAKSGISTTSTKLNYGGTITLKGSTLDINKKAYPGLPQNIYYRPVNGTTFKLLKSLGSSSTGTVSYAFKPPYSAVYMLTFPGNGDLMGTRTNDITVLVTPTISSTLSPSSIKLGSSTKLSGVVAPAHSGKSVQLQRLVGKTWTAAASVKLSSTGGYAFGIKPTAKGKIAYRVYFPSDGDHTLAYSAIRTLTIT